MSRQLRDALRVFLAVVGAVLAIGGSTDALMTPNMTVVSGVVLVFAAYAWAQAEIHRYRSHLGSRHEKGEAEEDPEAEKRRRQRAKPKK